jgi:hypothetical protein
MDTLMLCSDSIEVAAESLRTKSTGISLVSSPARHNFVQRESSWGPNVVDILGHLHILSFNHFKSSLSSNIPVSRTLQRQISSSA